MLFELDRHNLIHLPVKVTHRDEVALTALVDSGSAGTVFHVERIQIGDTIVESFQAQFGDVSGDFGFGGILGADILRRLGAVIDYHALSIDFRSG